jgi:hypothetical protein
MGISRLSIGLITVRGIPATDPRSRRRILTPEATLIIRDFTQSEPTVSLSTFSREAIPASARGLEDKYWLAIKVSPGSFNP